jgi:hypothetical protein
MTDPTVCAALYFDPKEVGPISVAWLDEALRLLAQSQVPLRQFEVHGVPGGFVQDQAEPLPQRLDRLRAALSAGRAESLRLYAHPVDRTTSLVLCWRASAGIGYERGDGFLGVPVRPGLTFKDHLLATYSLTRLVAPCRYGIAYLRSAHLAPAFYARGMLGNSLEAPDWEDSDTGGRIYRFSGETRHLQGMLRSVYPVQLLSEAHRSARLTDGRPVAELGLGRWTQVEGGLWLWELNEEEMPIATQALERAGLILAA